VKYRRWASWIIEGVILLTLCIVLGTLAQCAVQAF